MLGRASLNRNEEEVRIGRARLSAIAGRFPEVCEFLKI